MIENISDNRLSIFAALIVLALITLTSLPNLRNEIARDIARVGPAIIKSISPSVEESADVADERPSPSSPAGLSRASQTELATLSSENIALGSDVLSEESAQLGLLPVDFSLRPNQQLASQVSAEDRTAVKTSKAVNLAGSQIGRIAIAVDDNAQSFADVNDVRALLKSRGEFGQSLARIPTSGSVTLAKLRDFGIDFRYDPIADRFELQPK